MSKIKDFCKKHREILMYLLFGVATTAVGWIVYFLLLWSFKQAFSLPADDTTSQMYIIGYTIAQIVQWAAAVLFAFFTNRKWVFTDADREASTALQLSKFAGGRVVTFLVDYLVTFFAAAAATALMPSLAKVLLFGRERNLCEIGAKLLSAAVVIVCNYLFSKIFVFKSKKS